MSIFQILNEKKFPLSVKLHEPDILPYYRWEHRCTLGYNARELMVFIDVLLNTVYVEEIVGGHLEQILDESLWKTAVAFAKDKGFLEIQPPITKDERARKLSPKQLTEALDGFRI